MFRFMRIICALLFLAGILSQETSARDRETVRTGPWGGPHMGMEVQLNSARVEFACAGGSIGQPIPLDRQGRFDVAGIYVQGHGGPGGEQPGDRHPARYNGRVQGNTMSVTVTLTDSREMIGRFVLTYGQSPNVTSCL